MKTDDSPFYIAGKQRFRRLEDLPERYRANLPTPIGAVEIAMIRALEAEREAAAKAAKEAARAAAEQAKHEEQERRKPDPEEKARHDEAMAYVRDYRGTWSLILDLRTPPPGGKWGTKYMKLSDRQVEVLLEAKARRRRGDSRGHRS